MEEQMQQQGCINIGSASQPEQIMKGVGHETIVKQLRFQEKGDGQPSAHIPSGVVRYYIFNFK